MNSIDLIKYDIQDKKIKGVLVQASDGETAYLDIKEYQQYLKNTNKKSLVRFPNEIIYDEIDLDFDKLIITNEFKHEYFGWYGDTAISLKK